MTDGARRPRLDRVERLALALAATLLLVAVCLPALVRWLSPPLSLAAAREFAGTARVHSHFAWHVAHAPITCTVAGLLVLYAIGARRQLGAPRGSLWVEVGCVAFIATPPAALAALAAALKVVLLELPGVDGMLLPLPLAAAGTTAAGVVLAVTIWRLRRAPTPAQTQG